MRPLDIRLWRLVYTRGTGCVGGDYGVSWGFLGRGLRGIGLGGGWHGHSLDP